MEENPYQPPLEQPSPSLAAQLLQVLRVVAAVVLGTIVVVPLLLLLIGCGGFLLLMLLGMLVGIFASWGP